jgi:putative ABC transport system permease protein
LKSDIVAIAWRELKQHKRRTLAVISGYALIVAFLIVLAAVLFYSRVVQNITIGEAGTYFVTWLPACGDISSLSEEDLARLARGIIPEVCKEQCENCTGCNKKPFDIINEGFVINTNGTRLLSFEIVEKIAALPLVKDASPCLMFRFRDPQTNTIFAVGGIDPRSSAVSTNCCAASDVVAGTFLDVSQVGRVLVDVGFAGNHGLECGSRLVIASETFEVAGIVNSGARPVKPDVVMLYAEAERVINRRIHNPLEGSKSCSYRES